MIVLLETSVLFLYPLNFSSENALKQQCGKSQRGAGPECGGRARASVALVVAAPLEGHLALRVEPLLVPLQARPLLRAHDAG